MRAEIVSIGTELLLGSIVDTNSQFLANHLASLGMDLYYTCSVGDNYERLREVLEKAWQRSDLILTTGGLGPTQDDITRETIGGLLHEELEVDPGLKQGIINFFARRRMGMSANNIKQATLIPSATAISNPQGTAPGWWVEKEGHILVAMPGPPAEMQFMWQNEVFPRLQQKTNAIILSRTLKTFGLSEAQIDESVTALLSLTNPTLATYAKADGIHLRITAKAARAEEAREMLSEREAEVRAILEDSIWGVDDDTQESITGQLLLAQGLSLAVAEGFTGGLLTRTLANIPPDQNCFKGGIVVTTDEAKIALGIEPQVITTGDSSAVAAALASLARRQFNADIGIGLDGNTESVNGAETSRVFIAIDRGLSEQPVIQDYSGRHHQVLRRLAYFALSNLRKLLTSV
ncbi:CinA family nicotinamide mononucleotide deamidase-related protein [Chloroflexota bacterium]